MEDSGAQSLNLFEALVKIKVRKRFFDLLTQNGISLGVIARSACIDDLENLLLNQFRKELEVESKCELFDREF